MPVYQRKSKKGMMRIWWKLWFVNGLKYSILGVVMLYTIEELDAMDNGSRIYGIIN